jgi:peroxiredoxin
MLFRNFCFLILAFILSGCGDLNPSSADLRPPVEPGTSGPAVGQIAPDFALFDTLNNTISLTAELVSADAVVLYFTMWCPICDSHMSHMRANIIPNFPNVKFYMVDYVSGNVEYSRDAQLANGYADLDVLVDDIQEALNLYDATMGSTIVIDKSQIVQLNEDYKDGTRLVEVLNLLP